MTQKTMLPRNFGKIILTLENCIIPDAKLDETPSSQDGLDKETETDLRILGCELIQTAGILLKLPQVAMATGQVLLQRFFFSKSYVRHSMEITAMSCLCLASKIEEAPRRIRDVINVFHHIKQVRAQKPITSMVLDANYISLKTQVIKAERRVLKELGFCVHVKHPHKLIVMYLQVLGYEKNQQLMQMAWNFMNDSLRTDVFVRYNPETIACACIYLTARKLNLPLPNNPSWFAVFKVTEDEILDISYRIMDLYRRPKPNVEALEAAVEGLKKKYAEARNKNKPAPSPPPAVTTADRYDSSHNAWGGFISRTLPVTSNIDSKSASQQQAEKKTDGAQGPKRSRSRSISKSASISPDENRSRGQKKSRHRSRSKSPSKYKKKASRYTKSPSLSPQLKQGKKRNDRKSPNREKGDYYSSNGHGGNSGSGANNSSKDRNRDRSDNRKDRHREKDRPKHDRYRERSRSREQRQRRERSTSRYRDRSRDRERDRKRV